jgi:AraC family transcriptional regulator
VRTGYGLKHADLAGKRRLGAVYAARRKSFGIPPWRLARVLGHIQNNLDKPLAVRVLCGMVEMSQSHFSKLFKVSTGLAPHQYVLQERINRSKLLLSRGQARIIEVALEVGFENQAHFTTVFGNLVGMTPRQFQRQRLSRPEGIYDVNRPTVSPAEWC